MKDERYNAFALFLNGHEDATAEHVTKMHHDDIEEWDVPEVHEGKLAVDVAHNRDEIIVVSTMAGAIADKIEVYVHNDLLTIRGKRISPFADKQNIEFFYAECYWGVFSRSIVLPTDVKGELARAEYKNGILTVTVPKREGERLVPIEIIED